MNTPITDELSTFLVTQFPATLGNIELNQKLLKVEQLERELNEAKRQAELYNKDMQRVMAQRDEVKKERNQWRECAEELAWITRLGEKEYSISELETINKILTHFNELKGKQ